MSRLLIITFFTASLLADPPHAIAAGIQKWVDENGKVHYGEKPPSNTVGEAVDAHVTGSTNEAAPAQINTSEVVLYTTSWCGYCRKARAYLRRNSIAFTEYDIERDPIANARHKQLGGRGVPLLVKGGRKINGFNRGSYDRFFKS